jgi:hypothetical protein
MKFRSNGTKGFNIHFDDTNANEKLKIQLDESGTTTDFMTLVGPPRLCRHRHPQPRVFISS